MHFAALASHRRLGPLLALAIITRAAAAPGVESRPPGSKTAGFFYPPELTARARENIARYRWAADTRRRLIAAARPWMAMSDDRLWDLMFGNTIYQAVVDGLVQRLLPRLQKGRADVQLADRRAQPPVEGSLPTL